MKTSSTLILIVIAFGLVFMALITKTDFVWGQISQLGSLGDSFGPITSFFSALAFWGVYRTLILQHHENERLKKEMENRELNERIRSYENTFFNLLNTFQNIISDMQFERTGVPGVSNGRIIFTKYYEDLHPLIMDCKTLCQLQDNASEDEVRKSMQELKMHCTSFFSKRTQLLSHYVRYVINLTDYISEGKIPPEEKQRCLKIFKSQISNYEMILMFYFAMTSDGAKLKKCIEINGLFTDFPIKKLKSKHQISFINETAWKERKFS